MPDAAGNIKGIALTGKAGDTLEKIRQRERIARLREENKDVIGINAIACSCGSGLWPGNCMLDDCPFKREVMTAVDWEPADVVREHGCSSSGGCIDPHGCDEDGPCYEVKPKSKHCDYPRCACDGHPDDCPFKRAS